MHILGNLFAPTNAKPCSSATKLDHRRQFARDSLFVQDNIRSTHADVPVPSLIYSGLCVKRFLQAAQLNADIGNFQAPSYGRLWQSRHGKLRGSSSS